MKLPQLLSQYLYQTKKLDLPGLGSFVLDPTAVIPEESDKNVHAHATGISFKNTTVSVPDDALINFIKEHTGKMKPLAASDLEFFLTTGKQLLNIGKPFYLEGIGTLIKTKDGRLDFTPGEYSTAKLEEPGHGHATERKERTEKSAYDEPRHEYEHRSNNTRQILLLLGIIIILGAIGYGGYYLYKRNTYVEQPTVDNTVKILPDTTVTKPADTTAKASTQPAAAGPAVAAADQKTDSSFQRMPLPGPDQALYKFIILETDRKTKALRRYNQLLGFQLNIKMEQKDSAYFKLYFPIAAAVRDTAHIKDSLTQMYAAHVSIER